MRDFFFFFRFEIFTSQIRFIRSFSTYYTWIWSLYSFVFCALFDRENIFSSSVYKNLLFAFSLFIFWYLFVQLQNPFYLFQIHNGATNNDTLFLFFIFFFFFWLHNFLICFIIVWLGSSTFPLFLRRSNSFSSFSVFNWFFFFPKSVLWNTQKKRLTHS